jgi:hypothetical protein
LNVSVRQFTCFFLFFLLHIFILSSLFQCLKNSFPFSATLFFNNITQSIVCFLAFYFSFFVAKHFFFLSLNYYLFFQFSNPILFLTPYPIQFSFPFSTISLLRLVKIYKIIFPTLSTSKKNLFN